MADRGFGIAAGVGNIGDSNILHIVCVNIGKHCIKGSAAIIAILDICHPNKSVTKLKITITQTGANPVDLTAGMFWLVTDTSGNLYPASVEKNGNEYTLTFGTAFSVLKTFTVNITTAMGRVTFDNISIAD